MTLNYTYADNILEINLDTLVENYRIIKSQVKPHVHCAAVVKADAYGLGAEPVAGALYKTGCREFFVATLEEGIALRNALPEASIYVLYGIQAGQEQGFLEYRLVPVLNDLYQVELWRVLAGRQGKKLPAIVHVDTGMCRLGLGMGQFEESWDKVSLWEGIEVLWVMSHLACANEPEHYLNMRQLRQANEMKKKLGKVPLSLANSGGIFLGEAFHFDGVRPGISLYGASPLPEGRENPMRQVVSLKTRIIQWRKLDKPETVGYGATCEMQAGSCIATLAIGYADGYMRSLSNKGICSVGGFSVPVVGRVSMDLVMIDVTNVPEHVIYPGAEVEVIGAQVTLNDVAKRAGTVEYEVLTGLGKRFKRIYK